MGDVIEALILSNALDTNGQNYRYVLASRKYGGSEPVLTAFAIGKVDPGGVVGRLQVAADKGDAIRIRSAHRASAYFEFPTDLIWDRRTEPKVRELARAADVIHLNNSEIAYRKLRLRKPALLHHHGSLFRNNPQRLLDMAERFHWQQAVSTIDLQKPAPDLLPWLPTAYDVDALQAFGREHRRASDGRVRIVHAPTNRALKHTAVFLDAVRQLQDEGLPIDLDLVEGVTWAECMDRKAKADIVFDQLAFGYGCNAVEAWGMGIPVIAGAEDEWVLHRMAELWSPGIPFVEASPDRLKAVMRRLVEEPTLREYWAGVGLAHVRKYHDEQSALTILADLYAKAIEKFRYIRIASKAPADRPVAFIQRHRQTVYDGEGNPIVFVDGRVETQDPFVIERLRYLAKRPARFGIEEETA